MFLKLSELWRKKSGRRNNEATSTKKGMPMKPKAAQHKTLKGVHHEGYRDQLQPKG